MAVILVVDDDPVSQRMLSYMLRRAGYAVMMANQGLQALERLAAAHIDLVICDLNMPEMDGITLLQEMRADDRYREMPFIMLTASGQDDDRQAVRDYGANDYLTKPTSSHELVDLVDKLLA